MNTAIGNAEIGVLTTNSRGDVIVVILGDDGKTYRLDKRAVKSRTPKPGQRGRLEYRDYEFGARWFFDAVPEVIS